MVISTIKFIFLSIAIIDGLYISRNVIALIDLVKNHINGAYYENDGYNVVIYEKVNLEETLILHYDKIKKSYTFAGIYNRKFLNHTYTLAFGSYDEGWDNFCSVLTKKQKNILDKHINDNTCLNKFLKSI